MSRHPHPRPQGVVLIVVLIMLVVIGLTSVAVMRDALSADMISNNARSESLATEAAQAALAYCEKQMLLDGSGVTIKPAIVPPADPNWRTYANWRSTAATTVPTEALKSTAAAINVSKPAQCMAEYSGLITGNVVLVTARGFSPDYTEDTSGRSKSGSAVWLQSTVRLP
jgi:type II secretory pathway pseudopilin PulG